MVERAIPRLPCLEELGVAGVKRRVLCMKAEGDHIVGAPGRLRGRDGQRGGRRHQRRQLRFSFEIECGCFRGVGEVNGFVFVGVDGFEGEAEVGGEVVVSISGVCHRRIHDGVNRFDWAGPRVRYVDGPKNNSRYNNGNHYKTDGNRT
ncbi:unnamed protein product [Cuscuta europaea]|uniref:Uncharacterized protein n=1 Tax=Cuscuta europaea TaxID=41803 RepID=A0A9P0ZY83_CUSEU|nr:unnamed protein product [Cuscuta europaea]